SRETTLLSSVEHRWRGWWFERRRHALISRGGRRPFLHRHHEAIPRAIDGLDELWTAPAVPKRLADGFHRTVEPCVADKLLRPDLLTQLLLGDHSVRMRDQICQDLEHFAPQPPDTPGAAQLIALCVEGPLAKDIPHSGSPSPDATGLTPHEAPAATRTAGVRACALAPVRSVLPPQRCLCTNRTLVYHWEYVRKIPD